MDSTDHGVARALAEVTCSRNKAISRRHDAPALALLDIEVAQFGDFAREGFPTPCGARLRRGSRKVHRDRGLDRADRAPSAGSGPGTLDWLKAALGPASFPPASSAPYESRDADPRKVMLAISTSVAFF